MKMVLLSVGKTDDNFSMQLIENYRKKVNFYAPFDIETVPDIKTRKTYRKKNKNYWKGKTY